MASRHLHNRNRNFRGLAGHNCAVTQVGSPRELQAPPLEIETTARENAVWVRLRGEADLGNHEQLQSSLTQMRLDGVSAVHLVLAELTFCDLSALRHLVAFAHRVREAGRELSTHGARPTIKKVAGLMNVAEELHFV